jgi:hypothetical protein
MFEKKKKTVKGVNSFQYFYHSVGTLHFIRAGIKRGV